MAQQFNKVPQFNQPLNLDSVTNKDWYFFFVGLFRGLAPGNESAVTPTGSPFTYSAAVKGSLIVQGGTVSQIAFTRDGVTTHNVGATSGMFPMNAADRIIVTYTIAPNITFVPT